jgi:hypothetical protein
MGPSGDLLFASFRVERGIEYLKGLGLEVQQAILADAVRKAFPGLKEGFRPHIAAQQDGPALLVRVTVPHAYIQDRDLIPSPSAQARFANEVYRMGGELQNRFHGEILPVRPAPARAAPTPPSPTTPSRALERISGLAPVALRAGRTLWRWARELLPEED